MSERQRANHGWSGTAPFVVGKYEVGPDQPPFVIAEMSANHNGDLERALDIVRAAAEAGAHAVKMQTYTADTMTLDVDEPAFRLPDEHGLWGGRGLYDLYQEAALPWDWHEAIFALGQELGLVVFSVPFDPTAVDFLERFDQPLYKVASTEVGDLPLIRRMAETGKPLIVSTGTASLTDIDAAVTAARETGNEDLLVFACTATYPAPPEDSNLRRIPALREILGVQTGLSDHTIGIGVALAAIGLGATAIEKHVTLSRADGGPDAAFSLEPDELAQFCREAPNAWRALGTARVRPAPSEATGLRYRRSLWVTRDVRAGEQVTADNVRSVRPAGGLPPDAFATVAGRTFRTHAVKGTPLTWDLL